MLNRAASKARWPGPSPRRPRPATTAAWTSRSQARGISRCSRAAAAEAAGGLLRGLSARGLPCFPVPPSAVRVLHEPAALHTALLDGAGRARRRVSLASLYLGTGPTEGALVDALLAGAAAAPERRTALIVDYHRARRRGAAAPLERVAAAPRSRVSLLGSPASAAAGGVLGADVLPPEVCEVFGVQHVKAAVFDDDVLLTGANLSHDYLTNRQDRYLLLRGVPHVASFVCDVLDALAANAHRYERADDAGATGRPPRVGLFPPAAGASPARAASDPHPLASSLGEILGAARAAWPAPDAGEVARGGCWLAPMAQMGAIGVDTEGEVVEWLLRRAAGGDGRAGAAALGPSPLLLTSPYLNLTPRYAGALLQPRAAVGGATRGRQRAEGAAEPMGGAPPPAHRPVVVAAAPFASGFHGAGGVKGLIPEVYSALEAALLAEAASRGAPLELRHFARDGWTYHAKGVWMWPPLTDGAAEGVAGAPEADPGPVLTLIGSTNLSERSSSRDIELSSCLVTTDDGVRRQLQREVSQLLDATRLAALSAAEPDPPAGAPPARKPASLVARGLAVALRGFF